MATTSTTINIINRYLLYIVIIRKSNVSRIDLRWLKSRCSLVSSIEEG